MRYRCGVLLLVAGGAITAAASAAPGSADLARCAKITDPGQRLACFDSLASGAAAAAATASAPATVVAAAPPAPTTPVPAAPQVATRAVPMTASDPAAFGLSAVQRNALPEDQGPKSIRARISAVNEDRAGVSLRFDNGQVWAVEDPDQRLSAGEVVTIQRASLGSFLMRTQSHHTYRVRRIS